MNKVKLFLFAAAISLFAWLPVTANAEELEFADFYNKISEANGLDVKAGENLSIKISGQTYSFIGEDGFFSADEGSINLKNVDKKLVITINGTATASAAKTVLMYQTYPLNVVVAKDSTLNVNGGLILPEGTATSIENNGTVNVNKGAKLEIRNNTSYSGTVNVYGTVTVYGQTGTNVANASFKLFDGGNLYSDADLTDKIVADSTYKIVDNDKNYNSLTENPDVVSTVTGTDEFPFGYTLEKITTTDDNNSVTTDNNTNTVDNPETADNILMYLFITIIAMSVIAYTVVRLRKQNN